MQKNTVLPKKYSVWVNWDIGELHGLASLYFLVSPNSWAIFKLVDSFHIFASYLSAFLPLSLSLLSSHGITYNTREKALIGFCREYPLKKKKKSLQIDSNEITQMHLKLELDHKSTGSSFLQASSTYDVYISVDFSFTWQIWLDL